MIEAIKNEPVIAAAIVVSGTVLTIALVRKINKVRRADDVVVETHNLIENLQKTNAN